MASAFLCMSALMFFVNCATSVFAARTTYTRSSELMLSQVPTNSSPFPPCCTVDSDRNSCPENEVERPKSATTPVTCTASVSQYRMVLPSICSGVRLGKYFSALDCVSTTSLGSARRLFRGRSGQPFVRYQFKVLGSRRLDALWVFENDRLTRWLGYLQAGNPLLM